MFLDDTRTCFGRYGGVLEICIASVPERLDAFNSIDTSSGCTRVITQRDPARTVCVVAATNINLSAGLRVVGARPLAILATEVMLITGDLDASSKRSERRGAGGGFAACDGAASRATRLRRRWSRPAASGGSGGGGGGGGGGGAWRDPAVAQNFDVDAAALLSPAP